MFSDKLKDLTPLSVTFFQGESPTAEKLEGMMAQVEEALEYVEYTVGDAYNRTGYSTTWLNNVSRMLGDTDALSPYIQPSYNESGYVQQLTIGEVDHELDLIPVGSGAALLTDSFDSSVVIGQYKASVDLLEVPGDWTIQTTIIENNNQKNQKRLVTHSPSEGGSITFADVTTGRGSCQELSSYNVIPTVAQAEDGGPFLTVALQNAATNTYVFTLPEITKRHNMIGDVEDASLSNTTLHVVPGRNYELPAYFFDTNGLDLETDDTGIQPEKVFPANILQLYTYEDKQRVEGIEEITASQIPSARRYQFSVRFAPDVILDTNLSYMVSVSGTSISDYLRNLSHLAVNHDHATNDMSKRLSHKDLMDLRTDSVDYTNRSPYYGPSNIRKNDHSMYLHRDGFTDADVGAGGNVMRGDIVIGNTDLGAAGEHEHFNLNADSYSLYLGNRTDSPRFYFEKAAIHSTTEGRNNIAKDYTGHALKIIGPVNTVSTFKNTIIEGALRVTTDVVLGSQATDSVIISGNAYVHKSLTFVPVDESTVPKEEGSTFYDDVQKELTVYNGSKNIAPGRTGIAVLVGDGITSWGKYNGTGITVLENALTEASATGGVVLVQEGTYDVGFGTLNIPTGVTLKGLGSHTIIKGSNTLITIDTKIDTGVKDLVLSGPNPGPCQKAISIVNSMKSTISGVEFKFCQQAGSIDADSTYCQVEANCTFESVDSQIIAHQSLPMSKTNRQAVYRPFGFVREMTLDSWGSKEDYAKRWQIDSGAITIAYDETIGSSKGKGAFKVNGLGRLLLDEVITIAPNIGHGGYAEVRKLGASGQISLGAMCYDQDMNLLGDNGGFVIDNVNISGTTTAYHGSQTLEGGTKVRFPAGTRFVRPYIETTQNDAGIYIDNFEIYPLVIARISTFS